MFDFSKMDIDVPELKPAKYLLEPYFEQVTRSLSPNYGLLGHIQFNRSFLIYLIKVSVDNTIEQLKSSLSEDDLGRIFLVLNQSMGNYIHSWNYTYPDLLVVSDYNVLNHENAEPRSQVIGLAAYASMSLFVDLMLGVKRHHIDTFGVIDNRLNDVLNAKQSTKQLLLQYLDDLIDFNLFSVGDYGSKDVEESIKKNLFNMALFRFDEAAFFYAKETQWLNLLEGLNHSAIPLSEIKEE